MSEIRFYFDENMPTAVEEQLKRLNVDVVSAHSLDLLGKDDLYHLRQAIELKRVLCTHDTDFIELAKIHLDHHGIMWGAHTKASIGGWVRELRRLHKELTAEEMVGQVKFVRVK